MGKRKTSKKKEPKEFKSRQSSFWSNAGSVPIAAINPNRPFDFQVGIPNVAAPFEYGSIQYVVTELKVPNRWVDADCFKLTCAHLFQDIRENLRSNLHYDEIDLRCYLANVTWLQSIFSTIQRDFAFKYFRDAQHPSFDKIWGHTLSTEIDSPLNPVRPSVSIESPIEKTYLQYGTYAENLTYYETVLLPASTGIILPPAISEYLKWLFDGVFTDEPDPSRGQYYWNEIRSIPIYAVNAARDDLDVVGILDSAALTLEALAQYVISIASNNGTIIADLKRCGAQMVFPDVSTERLKSPVMKYDEMYFLALENAYTGPKRYVTHDVLEFVDDQEFFNIDIIPGMSDAGIASALSLLGGLDHSKISGISIPMYPVSQYALIWLDYRTQLLTAPFFLNENGVIKTPASFDEGVYALRYDSNTGGYLSRDSSGPIEPTSSLNTTDSYFAGDGYYSGTAEMPLDSDLINNLDYVSVFMFGTTSPRKGVYAEFSTSGAQLHTMQTPDGTGYVLDLNTTATTYWRSTTTPNVPVDMHRSGETDWRFNGSYTAYSSAAISNALSLRLEIIPKTIKVGFKTYPTGTYNVSYYVSLGTSSPGTTVTSAMTGVFSPGTLRVGEQDASVTAWNEDPSKNLIAFIRNEVEHHIPMWEQEVFYDVDNDAVDSILPPTLEKKTRSTTLYSYTELNAYLYQLYYSLLLVHSKKLSSEKKA